MLSISAIRYPSASCGIASPYRRLTPAAYISYPHVSPLLLQESSGHITVLVLLNIRLRPCHSRKISPHEVLVHSDLIIISAPIPRGGQVQILSLLRYRQIRHDIVLAGHGKCYLKLSVLKSGNYHLGLHHAICIRSVYKDAYTLC